MKRILTIFLTVLLLTCFLATAAFAGWHSYSCKVNEYVSYSISVEESIDYISLATGTVPPGISVDVTGTNEYTISGTPSGAGVFQFSYNIGHGDTELTDNITIVVDTAAPTAAPAGSVPTVTKSPTDDSAHEGDSVLFIARADNAESYSWYCTVGGVTYSMPEAIHKFPELSVSGDGTERLTLSNVPASLQGASFYCSFSNAYGSVNSASAMLYVLEALPSASPTNTPNLQSSTPMPSAVITPVGHEHKFSQTWSSDNEKHWHECECGQRTEEAEHSVSSWAQQADGSETGICSVCGAVVTKAAVAASPSPMPEKTGLSGNGLLLLLILLAILLVLAILVFLFLRSRKARTPRRGYEEDSFKPERPNYNPRHDGIHDDEDRAAYYREQLRKYEQKKK